jgi:elongation factor G
MSEARGTRVAGIVGPYLSGKTTLLENILFVTGAVPRKGSVKERNTVGDWAPEARSRQMSTEISVASTSYLDDTWTFIDCPGSIELLQETTNALMAVDIAIVVYEPSTERALTLSPLLKFLEDRRIPYMIFLNKMDTIAIPVLDVYNSIKPIAGRPLLLRHIPIREREAIVGYVDLISERAYKYSAGEASEMIPIPPALAEEHKAARQAMLESLSDFDDTLLEKLLEDQVPTVEEIYGYLATGVRNATIAPVLIGSAEKGFGVRRLLKSLRHDTPQADAAAARLGLKPGPEPTAMIFKTVHAQQSGKLSLARVWSGTVNEGMTLGGQRLGSLLRVMGGQTAKLASAKAGDVVALGRVDAYKTGMIVTASGKAPDGLAAWPSTLTPVYALAITPENRSDEVKLTGALQRINEEDPTLSYEHNPDTHEMVLLGQGEIHLQIALEKLKGRYNVANKAERPSVAYKETIRRAVSQHGRFKRQTGGHGMFGDVHVDIAPLPRGSGIQFDNKVVGGAVPRQFIPAVEAGVREYAVKGPLGFPVVDFAVVLIDGKYHAVDSNEMSFKLAGREAMNEGMPKCDPVLLEPIAKVTINIPNESTNKVLALVSGRRGQILGYAPREGWTGWDTVQANIPMSEIHDLIIELRSLTLGVGTYRAEFDRLQELTGRLADQVITARAAAGGRLADDGRRA